MKNSIVINTKVTLSRNITNYPFPHKLNQAETDFITTKIKNIILNEQDLDEECFIIHSMKDMSPIEKDILVERNIIDYKFSNSEIGSIIINKNKQKSIIINGEDHIKISSEDSDFSLDNQFMCVNKIDDILGSKIDYAFKSNIGYLTSNPVNAGTGLKISVIVHLPVLALQKRIGEYSKIANKLGLIIKGVCNQTSNTLGSMYEISNQSIIGKSEKNIIESIRSLIDDIVKKENQCRELAQMEASIELEDKACRSLAILQNCKIISAKEAMGHLSNIKLGIEMGYLKDVSLEKVTDLMKGTKLPLRIMLPQSSQSNIKRADFLRNEFTLANRNKK